MHARLAVINPSEEGLQPVEHEGWAGALNGEIYNWLSLRRPDEKTDTQVLLRIFAEEGTEGLKRCHGFWAFAAIDPSGAVYLARDQFGVRPLYYAEGPDWFVAASTIRSLAPLLPERPSLDYQALSEWALYQLPLGHKTFLKGIWRVLPGELVTVRPRYRGPYEDIWASSDEPITEDWFKQAQEILATAVVEATTADVGFTSTCSGGLDSSVVTRIASPSLAFHANYADPAFNETQWARAAVANTPTRLYTVNATEPEEIDLCQVLDDLIQDQDDLTVGSVILPLSQLFQAIAHRYKVVLLGTGGDELFGGYVRLDMAEGRLNDQPAYRAAFEKLAGITDPAARYELLHRKGNVALFSFFDAKHAREAFQAAYADQHPLQFERKYFLPALLTIDDRIAGRYGIEGRPALLHQALVRHVAKLAPDALLRYGLKSVARKVFQPFLPEAVLHRSDKKGFPTPIGAAINANAARIRERLTASPYKHLYNLANVRWTTEDAYDRSLFGLLQLDAWLASFQTSLSHAQAVE